MTPRLNINLKSADKTALLELRKLLETEDKRLSLAEVVRRAIHIAHKYEASISKLTYPNQ
mgnify:CR=1 FL=1